MPDTPIAYLDLDAVFCPPCSIGLAGQDGADHAELVGTGALVPIYNVLDLVPDNRACYQCSRPLGAIPPETQIANVRAVLADLRAVISYVVDAEYVATVERHLAELEARHAAGDLAPLPDDGLPF